MKDKDIIQQLKDNEKPFGLMSEEMQEKAREIGFHGNFRLYAGSDFGGIIDNPEYSYSDHIVYRLRSTYAEEPEIEECEICLKVPGNYLYYVRRGVEERRIHKAYDDPSFAGTKFKPVFGEEIYTELWLNLDVEQNGNYKMTHASHVLFLRRQE